MARMTCSIVTPEATAVKQQADFVAIPLYDGEIGIQSRHAPLIGRLGYGEIRLHLQDKTERYYVDGGFVQVADETISVLTNRAIRADQIDVSAAQEQLSDALKRSANTPELMEIRERLVAQARGQLRVARRAEESK